MATPVVQRLYPEDGARLYHLRYVGRAAAQSDYGVYASRVRPLARSFIGDQARQRRMERRISERGSTFLPQARSRDISSAKFRTAITARPPHRQAQPARSEDFRALASGRLDLPQYILSPVFAIDSERRVAGVCRAGEANPLKKCHAEAAGSVLPKSRIREWYDLVVRPVTRRPQYAVPITCKTPSDAPQEFGYLRPSAGLFYSVERALPKKSYEVNPEFLSESRKPIVIKEMASNTLKFGWG